MVDPKMETISENQNFHFPAEILIEILTKLPVKSIFRFRCVSKYWLSVISNPSFFPYYISKTNESFPFTLIFNMHSSYISTWSNFKSFTTFPCDQIGSLKVEATCNDLILYRSVGRDLPVYFLANPSTKKFIILPMHTTRRSYGSTGLISRVRNGITSYNIVRLIKNSDQRLISFDVETFSSEEGVWRDFRLKNCIFNLEVDKKRPCIVFKGEIHWICNKMTTLLAYDPCNSSPNQCRFISVPNGAYNMNGMSAILGISGEKLYYFEMSRISIEECEFPGWKLWVLRDYEKGIWSLDKEGKERRVDESFSIACNVLSTHSPLFPVAFHPWSETIVYFWYEGYILSFNVEIGWFEDKFSRLSSENMISLWEIFPLLVQLCPTHLPQPQWDWQSCRNGG